MRYSNILEGIHLNEVMYSSAKDALNNNYTKSTMVDLLRYLKSHCMYDKVISIIISLFQDMKIEDEYVDILADVLLNHFPYAGWSEYQEDLVPLFKNSVCSFSRRQLLLIGDCMECIYAKGFCEVSVLLRLIYRSLKPDNGISSYIDTTSVRIISANIAYNCNRFIAEQSVLELKELKSQLKMAKADWLKPIVNYYIGICKRYCQSFNYKGDYYYIKKSANCGFELALIYIDHCENNSETSKRLRNPQ